MKGQTICLGEDNDREMAALIEDGQVAFMHADADYRKRLEPARVLAAAGIAGS